MTRTVAVGLVLLLAVGGLAAVAVGTTCPATDAPWCVPLRTSPSVVATHGVASGSRDPWAGHEGEVVVLRVALHEGMLRVDDDLPRFAPGTHDLDEANRTVRLRGPAPPQARGALVMPDGTLVLVPVSVKLAATPTDHVLAILLPDYVQLDVRPTACTVGFEGSGRQYRQPVGTGARAGETQTLLLGPDPDCPAVRAGFTFVGRWTIHAP